MLDYRKGSHTCYDLEIHIVWITKYRKSLLRGMIAKEFGSFREICLANEIQIIQGHVSKEHIHLHDNYDQAINLCSNSTRHRF
ncbi:transposase [Catalinimonas niigatensis]|uniref:transposase n=1 Tax=Catalinimonas niigatensis TaxID=1397264 RepID=UPI00389921E8